MTESDILIYISNIIWCAETYNNPDQDLLNQPYEVFDLQEDTLTDTTFLSETPRALII